jgi:acetoin:2,6-dichlorophenolindophenol oxidoreductase subunit beta
MKFMPNKYNKSFSEAINEALEFSMKKDKNLICYGLGITDPKNIFGTTKNLEKKFGKKRVFDVPCSENALTGVSIGVAMTGIKSVVTHQRLDFFLLAMDQLVNSAAKWYFMFGGKVSIPITIRLILGKGWGQGPTHSQNLQAWFAHIPGLKVVMPTFPQDARDLLIDSINDPNPVIFLENRWLHSQIGKISSKIKKKIIGKSKIVKTGKQITIVAMSYLVIEAIKASKYLRSVHNIDCEIIDIRTIKPLDYKTIFKSVKKTKKLLVLDTGSKICSVASEIVSTVTINKNIKLNKRPEIITMPDIPEPTSYALTKNFFIDYKKISIKVLKILNKKNNKSLNKFFIKDNLHHDQPHLKYFGPF